MADITFQDLFDAVEADVVGGLSEFTGTGAGFVAEAGYDVDHFATGPRRAALAWTYECTHADWFQGIPPSGNHLTIRGATLVEGSADDPGSWQFRRYVDWLAVMGDIGYGLFLRQLVDDVDRSAMNNPKVPGR